MSSQAIAHPDFDPNTLENNLGIITLLIAITTSPNIAPVVMPTVTQTNLPLLNDNGMVAGFGYTQNNGGFANVLKVAFQRVKDKEECIASFPHLARFIGNVFCGESSNSNICAGDQGAGFVLNVGFDPVLVGIASFTNNNCAGGATAVYTRVNQYRPWIQQQTGQQW